MTKQVLIIFAGKTDSGSTANNIARNVAGVKAVACLVNHK